ncbi:MAG: hypothetical protein Q8916_00030 [Bacteroidota bacterium]|nr:hypothetical protein [Bacteroidota bacterium]MDP4236038.1 hypothetical protein [Bacteroidota bacterium]
MKILKPKKSKKGVVIATAVGSAVAAGATLLYTTKKGKRLLADASDKVSSLSSEVTSMLHKTKKAPRRSVATIKRAAVKKAGTAVRKAKRSVKG